MLARECNLANVKYNALGVSLFQFEDGSSVGATTAYKEAITAFGDDAEGYHDPLGDIFMSRISHGDHGQFFTPESISLLMSEIIMGDKLHDGMTVNDPACGTGRTLLMALKHIRSKGYEPKLYTNEGETVLDSCCGSGTTAIAAIREKRNFICIEKDPHYYEVAKKRMETELQQLKLF